jgi:hypothetical protein
MFLNKLHVRTLHEILYDDHIDVDKMDEVYSSGGSRPKSLGSAKLILHSKVLVINHYKHECRQHIKISCFLNTRFSVFVVSIFSIKNSGVGLPKDFNSIFFCQDSALKTLKTSLF